MEKRIWHDSYEPSVSPTLAFKDLALPAFLQQAAQQWPDRDALIFLNGRLTYRQLVDQVDRLATGLASLGVGVDSKVAIHLPNLPQTVIATEAVLRLGAQAVMTNPLYVERELEHQWNDAGVSVAITADFLFDQRLKSMRDKLPVEHYIVASVPEYLRFPLNLLAPLKLRKMKPPSIAKVEPGPGIHFFKKFIAGFEPAPPQVEIDPGAVAMIQYTGGTTGVSKGAMLTHRNLAANIQQISEFFTAVEPGKDAILAALPYFHIFGLTINMLWPIMEGATIVLMPNPRDLDAMISNIRKHRVTVFPAVPALFNSINNYPGIDKIDLSSVKACISGSAPLSEDVQRRFEALTSSVIVEGFGLTETSPVTHTNPLYGTRKIGSIGVPIPETDARIVDVKTGQTELPVGEEGELVVRGPQVMKGYWQRPEATAEMIRDGWLYTGDLATMDADGYFRIVGRKKDMIIASGYNIFPDEIDRMLMAHESVLEACTVGIPDAKRGETVKSFVVLQPGATATAADLEAYCRSEMAAYKVPDHFEFRDDLPKSSMMKMLRRVLRDEEIAKNA